MNLRYALLLVLLLPSWLLAQSIKVQSGTFLKTSGSTLQISVPGSINNEGNATIAHDSLTIGGDLVNTGAISFSSNETVLNGSSNQLISGNIIFDKLTILPGSNITLQSGETFTTNDLQLAGTSSESITIAASSPGSEATFNQASGTVEGTYLNLTDIHATGGATFNATNSTDNGNNDGWDFLVDFSGGLLAYYPFNNNANDESGNGNNGILGDGSSATTFPTSSTDRFGNANAAYSLDGTSDYIELPTTNTLLGSNPDEWTINIWFSRTSGTSLISDRDLGSSDNSAVSIFPGTQLESQIYESIGGAKTINAGTVESGQWHMATLTVSKTSGEMKSYLDGSLIGTETINNADYTNDYPLTIGGIRLGATFLGYFTGVVDDIRIYDNAVSELEITNLFEEGGWPLNSTETDFLSFSFPQQTGIANIDEANHTIEIEVSYGTDLSNLIATFTLSDGASAEVGSTAQVSATTENNFTNPVTYAVTAEDGITTQDWVVTVTEALNTATDFITFGFEQELVSTTPNTDDHTIDIKVIYGTNLESLEAIYSVSEGASVYIDGVDQFSGVILNDFTNPVIYTVIAQDGTTQDWTINVEEDNDSFVTTWQTLSFNETVTIPIANVAGYNYTVNWGDGTVESELSGSVSHVYTVPDEYKISIFGEFPRIIFGIYENEKDKIISIDQWGSIQWGSSLVSAFIGCSNLTYNATDFPIFPETAIGLNYMFQDCESFTGDLTTWDVSNVTAFTQMFFGATSFNGNITTWDVSNGILFGEIFSGTSFNQDISSWNMGNAVNIIGMFEGTPFNQDISTWNVSNVLSMANLFSNANNYNQSLAGWQTTKVTNMTRMFNNATSFNQELDFLDVRNVETMQQMFSGAETFNRGLNSWNVTKVTNMSEMFKDAISFNQPLNNWDVSNVNEMNGMFQDALSFNQSLESWDISNVTTMVNMLDNTSMSVENYDLTLIGWLDDNGGLDVVPEGITLGAEGLKYCEGAAARDELINVYNWTFIGDSKACNLETDFLTFSFPEETASITPNATNHTIDIEVAYGTDLTNLIATFTLSDGATAEVGSTAQVSATTVNDFTNPVTYTLTAEDGTTIQDWIVIVIEAPNDATDFLSFSFPQETASITPNTTDHTIDIEVAYGTDITNMVATFTLSNGASTEVGSTAQVSATTANDFTNPVTYTVTAEDGTTIQDWIVTVTEAPNDATDFLSFNFPEETASITPNATNHTIDIEVVYGTDLTNLIATFTLSDGATAEVGSTAQTSATTANDFTNSVTYTVTAEDGTTTQDWIVTVSQAPSYNIDLTGFTVTENEGTQIANFLVTISEPALADIDLLFNTSDASATSGDDYTAQVVTLITIPASQTSIDIPVDILGDNIAEPSEGFSGSITIDNDNGQQVIIGNSTANGTIIDNDEAFISIDDVTEIEDVAGGEMVFTITLTGNVQDEFEIDYTTNDDDASSISGSDYISSSGTIIFPAGSISGETQIIIITITEDNIAEPEESFEIELSNIVANGSNVFIADNSGIGTIQDDDENLISISGFEVTETGGIQTGNFTVTMTGIAQEDIIFSFSTTENNATDGIDFVGQSGIEYTLVAGMSSVDIPVDILGDEITETTEDFTGTIAINNTNGQQISITTNSALATINDDDADGDIFMEITKVQDGSEDGDDVVFEVKLTDGTIDLINDQTTAITADVTFTGTAPNADFDTNISTITSVSFGQGEGTKEIRLEVFDDLLIENLENITATLSNPSGLNPNTDPGGFNGNNSAIATVADNDVPIWEIINPVNAREGVSDVQYTVRLVNASGDVLTNRTGSDMSVDIEFVSGSEAVAGEFSTVFPTTITLSEGGVTELISLSPDRDLIAEGDELLRATLEAPINPATISAGAVTISTINGSADAFVIDDVIFNVVTTQNGSENPNAPIIYTISMVNTDGATVTNATGGSINVETSFTTGSSAVIADIIPVSFPADIDVPNGDSDFVINFPVEDDALLEGEELLRITIDNPSFGFIGIPTADATLEDDDNVALNTATDFLAFSFPVETATISPNTTDHTIDIEVAYGTDLTNLIATFTLSDGASTEIGSTAQVSATTTNDFTNPVTYTVTAEDGITSQDWTVTVTVDDGLLAHYPFNGNANDESGNGNNGTWDNDEVYFSDRFSDNTSAASFDGIDDDIVLANENNFDFERTDELTISAWIYPTTTNVNILSKQFAGTADRGYRFRLNDANLYFGMFFDKSTSNEMVAQSIGEVPFNTWSHVSVVYDGSNNANNIKLYINGNIQSNTIINNNLSNTILNDEPVIIGSYNQISNFFDGGIDELRIYNRVLSETEINDLYIEGGWPLTQEPIAYYPFNGNANDESGNGYNAAAGGAPTLAEDRDGNTDQAYSFDGIDDYFIAENFDAEPTDLSLVAWFKYPESGGTGTKQILDIEGVAALALVNQGVTGVLNIDGVFSTPTYTGTLAPEKWHMAALTYDGTNVDLYINGEVVARNADAGAIDYSGIENRILLGTNFDGSQSFLGELDDLSVYGKTLTPEEIFELFGNHLGPNTLIAESGNNQVTLKWSAERIEGLESYSIYRDNTLIETITITSVNDTTFTDTGVTNGTFYDYFVQSTDTLGNVSQSSDTITHLAGGLVAYYPFNGNANDESGNGYDGTNNNATLSTDRFGNTDAAYTFDGTAGNNFIEVSDNNALDLGSEDFTLHAWVSSSNSTDLQRIISKGSYIGSDGYMIRTSASGQIVVEINGTLLLTSNTSVTDGSWHMVTVTIDRDGDVSIYIDGSLDISTTTNTTSLDPSNTTPLRIGTHNVNQEPFYGEIDDVRIYNRVLTEPEIQDLYTEGGWPLSMAVTSTAPTDHAVNVARNGSIAITFEEAVDQGSVDNNNADIADDNITIIGQQSGPMQGTFSGDGTATITFSPANDFFPGELITVTITDQVTNSAGSVFAEPTSFQFTTQTATAPAQFSRIANPVAADNLDISVAVADFDGDGDLDILHAAIGDLGNISWYENADGLGNYGPQQLIGTSEGVEMVYATDIDGDGDQDVLTAASTSSEIAWFENTDGQGSFGSKNLITDQIEAAKSVISADIDLDGDLDIVVSGNGGTGYIAWIENADGLGSFSAPVLISTNSTGAKYAYPADLDGDGDIDVLSAETDANTAAWFENTDGAGTFGPKIIIDNQLEATEYIYATDIDGDSHLDIVTTSFGSASDKIAWYRNTDGQGTFGSETIIQGGLSGVTSVLAGDMDGDGDLDLVSSIFLSDSLLYHENTDGAGNFAAPTVITDAANGARPVILADLDGDLDLDVVVPNILSSTTVWYENTIPTEFITIWQTTSSDESITIPTFNGESYDYEVHWGDGTFDLNQTGNASHTYTEPGTYTVAISGLFPRIFFDENGNAPAGNAAKILSVEAWGTNAWTNMQSAFAGCTNLHINATDAPDLSGATSMQEMFRLCIAFNESIEHWDMSSIIDISFMFDGATSFNQPLNNWNVSNVTNMGQVFQAASAFNQDISNWNVGNVEFFQWMFSDAAAFDQPLTWDMSSATILSGMFAGATAFNQDISSWNVGNVTSMAAIFKNAINFDQDISSWNVSNVTETYINEAWSGPFHGATSFNQNLGLWDISNMSDMTSFFDDAGLSKENYDATLTGWATLEAGETRVPSDVIFSANGLTYCTAEADRQNLIDNFNWSISGDTKDTECGAFVTIWETTSPNESITVPTTGAGYDYTIDWGDGTVESLTTGNPTHTFASAGTHTISISGDFPVIYFNNGDEGQQVTKIKSIEQWGTIQWSTMNSAFEGCSELTYNATDAPDLSIVSDFNSMFRGCTSFNGNIDNWDMSTAQDLRHMFRDATSFNQPLNSWNVSAATDMRNMFRDATSFNQPLNNWQTTSLERTNYMFAGATAFNQNISAWPMSTVFAIEGMFQNATSFNSPLAGWDVSNVTNFSYTFNKATAFNQSVNSWNVSSGENFSWMFSGVDGDNILNSADMVYNQPLDNWAFGPNADNMNLMFARSTAFNQDLSTWNVSTITKMGGIFNLASSFDQSLGAWDISNLVVADEMLNSSGMSLASYDATLTGWATLEAGETAIPTGLSLGATGLIYCESEADRQNLIDNFSWTINDAGLDCTSLQNTETDFITFSFAEQTAAITPDAVNHTIDIEVNFGTDVTGLIATFELSNGATATIASTEQVSGITTNDFTNPVSYLVTAENGIDTEIWTVTVTIAPGPSGVRSTLVRTALADLEANGTDAATVVVQLRTAAGDDLALAGVEVLFEASGDGTAADSEIWSDPNAVVASSPGTITLLTDASGEARATLVNSEEEVITVTAQIDTNNDDVPDANVEGGNAPLSITYIRPKTIADINCGPTGSIITASKTTILADGVDESVITVQLRAEDDLDLQFADVNIKIFASGNALLDGNEDEIIITTNAAGVANTRISNTIGETVTVTGRIDKNQDGIYSLNEEISNGGNQGTLSLVFNPDPTPPVVSQAAIISINSNRGDSIQYESTETGTMYWLASTELTTITAAEIEAGTASNLTGSFQVTHVDSLLKANLAMSTLPETTHQLFLVQKDGDGNYSNIVQLSWLPDGTRPILETATIAGATPDQVALTFSEAIVLEDSMGWSIRDEVAGDVEITDLVHNGSTLIFTLERAMTRENNLFVNFSSNLGDVRDAAYNELTSISNFPVENNIPSEPPAFNNITLLSVIQDEGISLTYNANKICEIIWAISSNGTPPAFDGFISTNPDIIELGTTQISLPNTDQDLTATSPDLEDNTTYYLHLFMEDQFGDRSAIETLSWHTDGTGPLIASAVIEDASPLIMTLILDEASVIGNIGEISLEFPNGSPGPGVIAAEAINNQTIEVTLAREITQGDTLRLYYIPGVDDIQDELGNLIEPTYQLPVTNNVKDPPPVIDFWEMRAIKSTDSLRFAFSSTKPGTLYYVLTNIEDALTSDAIINPLGNSVRSGEFEVNTAGEVQEISLKDLDLLHDEPYTLMVVMVDELKNESEIQFHTWTADGVNPQLLSAEVTVDNPDILNLTFDEAVQFDKSGWNILSIEGAIVNLQTANSADGTSWQITLSRDINETDDLKIAYSPTAGNTIDEYYNELGPIESFDIDNQIVGIPPVLINVDIGLVNELRSVMLLYQTNEAGIIYWMATTSPTPPSMDDIKLGTDSEHGFGSFPVETINELEAKEIDVRSLRDATTYYLHLFQEDAFGNASSVISVDWVTPDNAMPILDPVEIVETQTDFIAIQYLLSQAQSATIYYAIYNQQQPDIQLEDIINGEKSNGGAIVTYDQVEATGGETEGITVFFDRTLGAVEHFVYLFAIDENEQETSIIELSWLPEVPAGFSPMIRNLVTPNGDGSNDLIYIENFDTTKGQATLYLINRQGKTVLTINNFTNNHQESINQLAQMKSGLYNCLLIYADGTRISETITLLKQ